MGIKTEMKMKIDIVMAIGLEVMTEVKASMVISRYGEL